LERSGEHGVAALGPSSSVLDRPLVLERLFAGRLSLDREIPAHKDNGRDHDVQHDDGDDEKAATMRLSLYAFDTALDLLGHSNGRKRAITNVGVGSIRVALLASGIRCIPPVVRRGAGVVC
jgi:hypothetical protein